MNRQSELTISDGADSRAALPHAQSWIWAILPEWTRSARTNNPRLATVLASAGLDVSLTGSHEQPSTFINATGEHGQAATIKYFGQPDPRPSYRPSLSTQITRKLRSVLAGALGAAAARLEHQESAQAKRTLWIGVGDRGRDSYPITVGRTDAPEVKARRVVIGNAGWATLSEPSNQQSQSVLEVAVEAAGRHLGTELTVTSIQVQESAKLIVRVQESRDKKLGGSSRGGDTNIEQYDACDYFIRIATGEARSSLEAGYGAVTSITAADSRNLVSDLIVIPQAAFQAGLAYVTVEKAVTGEHPRYLDPASWEQCTDFLSNLWAVDAGRGPVHHRQMLDNAAESLARLAPELGGSLAAIAARTNEVLVNVRNGWGHGDFWIHNLLIEGGELCHILDWETATADSLPLFDLFDLIGHEEPKLSGSPGPAFTQMLFPLLDRTSNKFRHVQEYCDRTGTPSDQESLTALVLAYWLLRTARDIETVADRKHLRGWIRDNVHIPTEFITNHPLLTAFLDQAPAPADRKANT